MRVPIWAGTAALGALVIGCGNLEEQVSPVPVETTSTTTSVVDDGGAGGSGGAAPDAGVKRTVIKRSPYGNAAEAENLLWDGDFEWLSPFSDQYGWLAGPSPDQLDFILPKVQIGAACRSGVKCARLAKNNVLAGIGVASEDQKLEASFWAHLSKGTCDQVLAIFVNFDFVDDPQVEVTPDQKEPDAAGFCHYLTVVDPRKGKPLLYIENGTQGEVLIDDAVIKRAPAAKALSAQHGPPSAELAAKVEGARAAVWKRRGPHDAPPNAAKKAYQQRKGDPGGPR